MKYEIDLELFKGGKGGGSSSTTSTQVVTQDAHVPDPSPTETSALNQLMGYNNTAMQNANALQGAASNALTGLVPVDYESLGLAASNKAIQLGNDVNTLRTSANVNTNNAVNGYTNNAVTANNRLADLVNTNNSNTAYYNNQLGQLGNAYNSTANAANNTLNSLAAVNASNTINSNNALSKLSNLSNNTTNALSNSYAGNTLANNNVTSTAYNLINNASNGVLNNNYINNKTAVIKDQLRSTLGDALTNLASRGVINSSVSDKAMQNIADTVTNSLNSSYNSDLAQEASLAQAAQNTAQSGISTSNNILSSIANLNNQNISNQMNLKNQINSNTQQGFTNQMNLSNQMASNSNNALSNIGNVLSAQMNNSQNGLNYNTTNANTQYSNNNSALGNITTQQNNNLSNQSSLIGQANTLAQAPLNIMNTAQTGATSNINNLLGMGNTAAGTMASTWEDLINNRYKMSNPNQMAVGNSTTTHNSGGGFWGAMGSAIGAFCFTGDTEIETPSGAVAICTIQPGDYVYNDTGNLAKVTDVLKPHIAKIVLLKTNMNEVRTTDTQPFMHEGNWVEISRLENGDVIETLNGLEKIISIQKVGTEYVYDLKLENGEGYIANGFIVKAGEDEWQ